MAYADIAIFLNSPADVQKLQETLLMSEAATGAKDNMRKTRALALSAWTTTTQIMDITYHSEYRSQKKFLMPCVLMMCKD
jgi:hypothetical protein